MSPTPAKAGTIRACSDATRMSQASAKARPTPAAAPLTAAMNALSVRVISFAIAPNSLRIQRQISVLDRQLGAEGVQVVRVVHRHDRVCAVALDEDVAVAIRTRVLDHFRVGGRAHLV